MKPQVEGTVEMKQSDPRHRAGRKSVGAGIAGWRQQLGELALACAGSFPADEVQRLGDMRRLLVQAPAPALVHGLCVPSAERLEQLIAADAADAAALALLGTECGYLLSRGAGGQHLASVILPGAVEEVSASGDTLALALVGALGLALSEAGLLEADRLKVERRTPSRSARLN